MWACIFNSEKMFTSQKKHHALTIISIT